MISNKLMEMNSISQSVSHYSRLLIIDCQFSSNHILSKELFSSFEFEYLIMKFFLSSLLLVLSTSSALEHSSHDIARLPRELKKRNGKTSQEPRSTKIPKAAPTWNRKLKEKKTDILYVSTAEEKFPDNVRDMTNAKSTKAPKANDDERFLKIASKKGKRYKNWKSTKAPKTSTKAPRLD